MVPHGRLRVLLWWLERMLWLTLGRLCSLFLCRAHGRNVDGARYARLFDVREPLRIQLKPQLLTLVLRWIRGGLLLRGSALARLTHILLLHCQRAVPHLGHIWLLDLCLIHLAALLLRPLQLERRTVQLVPKWFQTSSSVRHVAQL